MKVPLSCNISLGFVASPPHPHAFSPILHDDQVHDVHDVTKKVRVAVRGLHNLYNERV